MASLAIVGATGLVGQMFITVLQEYKMNFDKILLFASEKSQGKKMTVFGKQQEVKALCQDGLIGVDYALFSAGAAVSRQYALSAANNGTLVIDNSSCWRMESFVPLIVPEINFCDIKNAKLIANPNCSTIAAVLALNALKKFGIQGVNYATYQAVSGAGQKGLNDLKNCQTEGIPKFFSHNIAKTCIPQIDNFLSDGYTKEEEKMIKETQKILHLPNLPVSATCVRVPIPNGHGIAVSVRLKNKFDIEQIMQAFAEQSGVVLADDYKKGIFPLQTTSQGTDSVFVGRVRKDKSCQNGIIFFCVADNLRRGAASNAVLILKKAIENQHDKK